MKPSALISALLPRRIPLTVGLAALILLVLAPGLSTAQVVLFEEDFESLILGPNVDEPISFPDAFTHNPPPGWDVNASQVPGVGDPLVGVTEWEGWSFANKDFWEQTALLGGTPTGREDFLFGQGTIAVADPDQWNDLGDPANQPGGGYFNTLMHTPPVDISSADPPDIVLKLGFDSSWFGGIAGDDGRFFAPPDDPPPFQDNQTAIVNLVLDNGDRIELLRWEAAPFIDSSTGAPASEPGPNTIPNPDYKPFTPNERVWLDLEGAQAALVQQALGGAGSSTNEVEIEFGMEGAGDDGWWGVDNVTMFTVSTVQGDMNVNGMLDTGDVSAFALGLLSSDEYRNTYYGEFPVTRGSDDGTFDFDDIVWFVDLLETNGVSASVAEVVSLLSGPTVPEPGGIALLAACLLMGVGRRRQATEWQ